jgi:hypothetical protein
MDILITLAVFAIAAPAGIGAAGWLVIAWTMRGEESRH